MAAGSPRRRCAVAASPISSRSPAGTSSASTTAVARRGSRSSTSVPEQAAAFAAEGWAKTTRTPGVCALTAGPGVTNGVSAMASAAANGTPIVVLGGRAAEGRWGSGSLQEIDHLPFVSPLTKSAETVKTPDAIGEATVRAYDLAAASPTGPTFLDYPLDVVFMDADAEIPPPAAAATGVADGIERAAELLAGAERPAIMAGTGLYWAGAEDQLRELSERHGAGVPVFLNGMGRGSSACGPSERVQPHPRDGPRRGRRRDRRRRAARLPPRLRGGDRRRREADPPRRRAESPRAQPCAPTSTSSVTSPQPRRSLGGRRSRRPVRLDGPAPRGGDGEARFRGRGSRRPAVAASSDAAL